MFRCKPCPRTLRAAICATAIAGAVICLGSTPRPAAAATSGRVYYVSTSGRDSATGLSPSSAWLTLAKANSAVRPGDAVVLSGTFRGQAINPGHSGTSSAPITYRAATAGGAVIDGPGPVGVSSANAVLENVAFIGARSFIVLQGLTFTYEDYVARPLTIQGVRILGSDHVMIVGCAFTHVPLVIEGSSDNVIQNSTFSDYVSNYTNPATGQPDPSHPLSAGDMIAIHGGSSGNIIRNNVLRRAGHSLIEVGTGRGDLNAANVISGNVLSNPWYKDVILADDGGGTIVEQNTIDDANTQPTVYSTVCCPLDTKVAASEALQLSGSDFIVRDNTFTNNVASLGVISLGARWYVDTFSPNGVRIDSSRNQIAGNRIEANFALAGVSFVLYYGPWDIAAGRPQPSMDDNVISQNTFSGNTARPAPWGGTSYSDIVYYATSRGSPWRPGSLGTNRIVGNTFQAPDTRGLTVASHAVCVWFTVVDGHTPQTTALPFGGFETAVSGVSANIQG